MDLVSCHLKLQSLRFHSLLRDTCGCSLVIPRQSYSSVRNVMTRSKHAFSCYHVRNERKKTDEEQLVYLFTAYMHNNMNCGLSGFNT